MFCSLMYTQHPGPHLARGRDAGACTNVSVTTPNSTLLLTRGGLKGLLRLQGGSQAVLGAAGVGACGLVGEEGQWSLPSGVG